MVTRKSTTAAVALLCFHAAASVFAQSPPPRETGIRWVRDSAEYAALARQVYRLAGERVATVSLGAAPGSWVVILDLDETVLDNSTYQLERVTYGLPYDTASWNAWVRREQAAAVPGVTEFIAGVRQAGGRVAWISNRDAVTADATRRNLQALKLWDDRDRLCLQESSKHTKAMRRAEVVSGSGACGWAGEKPRVAAILGDQMGDFPQPGEQIAGSSTDGDFGRVYFLLPNPMYGEWTTRVTRPSGPQ